MTAPAHEILKFQTFSSLVNVSFWYELARRKLEEYKLSMSNVFVAGSLVNTNTVEEFRDMDKQKEFDKVVAKIVADIDSGAACEDPSLLSQFLLLTYADIKKYQFYYWFAWPALSLGNNTHIHSTKTTPLHELFSPEQIESLRSAHKEANFPAAFLLRTTATEDSNVEMAKLSHWQHFWKNDSNNSSNNNNDNVFVGFVDPCGQARYPSWALRNLLYLIARKFKPAAGKKLSVLCYRQAPSGQKGNNASIVIDIQFPQGYEQHIDNYSVTSQSWEKGSDNKTATPRFVSLTNIMDPVKLASNSVDLNLKLMKWRLLPSLDLDSVQKTRCLLLGAGTLGCNVARTLMAWGVRNITLVDNGNISFSNPVRQTLFEFEDCTGGGKPKAATAAARLKQIFPGVNAVGENFSIPMPGHAVPNSEIPSIREAVTKLETLVDNHDIIFILMDSRESRWLPTLLCAAKGKIAINTALGFDTYLVMRHGINDSNSNSNNNNNNNNNNTNYTTSGSEKLGCYFCNDVVAPANSLKDRTLDQQCTVTRPGLSFVASALAVELAVGLIQHPLGGRAPADGPCDISVPTDAPLGLLPHSIRGFLTHFGQILVTGQQYDKCTACSPKVVAQYQNQGFDFLLQVFNNPTYLEDIAGLTEMKQEAEAVSWEVCEDGGDDF